MSDIMTCMPFGQLMDWVLQEKKGQDTVFGVHRPYTADPKNDMTIFTRNLETPVGPAAGPHTQLAQNIVAAYFAGSRFFELKTVQIIDGEELAACISRPCILAEDEGYNCEWSTELLVSQACDEYIKAWLALKVFSKKFGRLSRRVHIQHERRIRPGRHKKQKNRPLHRKPERRLHNAPMERI